MYTAECNGIIQGNQTPTLLIRLKHVLYHTLIESQQCVMWLSDSTTISCRSTSLYDLLPVLGTVNGLIIGHRNVWCRACTLHQFTDQEMLHSLPSATVKMLRVSTGQPVCGAMSSKRSAHQQGGVPRHEWSVRAGVYRVKSLLSHHHAPSMLRNFYHWFLANPRCVSLPSDSHALVSTSSQRNSDTLPGSMWFVVFLYFLPRSARTYVTHKT